jgi:DNA-binding NtrC family response regulator
MRRPSILLVDDHEDTRSLLLFALELEGYDVVAAATAEEGLRLLQDGRFDLLLSDYCLPGHSGEWLLRQASEKHLLDETHALVLTAHPHPDGVESFQVVRKPFELEHLLSTIAEVLSECLEATPAEDEDATREKTELVLYVSSSSLQSARALRTITEKLREAGRHDVQLTVHDLAVDPSAGDRDRIAFTPTLVKRRPGPPMWILGDFSEPDLLHALLQDPA